MPVNYKPFIERIKGKPFEQVLEDYEAAQMGVEEIARDLGVSKVTVYQYLKQHDRETYTATRRRKSEETAGAR